MSPAVLAAAAFMMKPLAIVPAVAAAVLLLCGLRGGRTGREPHCRRCNQDLSSLGSNHCPKCGLLLMPGDVAYGSRQRRCKVVLVASLLVAISVAGLALLGCGWK